MTRESKGIGNEDIRTHFTGQSWLSYLPEVYSGDTESAGFLVKYLGIFQLLYEELNEQIKYSPISFCPEVCPQELLPVIAGWIGEKKYYLWKEKPFRHFLTHAMEFYESRGTLSSIFWLVSLYTGEPPMVVEYYELAVERSGSRKDLITGLYGANPYQFFVLLKEEYIAGNAGYRALLSIMEDVIPAHMECRLIALRPYIILNSYCYLGINSRIQKEGEPLL